MNHIFSLDFQADKVLLSRFRRGFAPLLSSKRAYFAQI